MENSQPWRGDLGLTDLIDRRDVPKSDLRIEVLGVLDEASSALGLVRAWSTHPDTREIILAVQRDLCWMMSELAAVSEEARPPTHITTERVEFLAAEFHRLTASAPFGNTFVVAGDTPASASLHLARTVVRRAERRVTLFHNQVGVPNPSVLAYLNRLSALLYALARVEDVTLGVSSTQARPSPGGESPGGQT